MKSLIKKHLKLPSPLQKLESDFLQSHQISLYLKRDDLIHQHISGNKWRKLKYNLLEAKKQNKSTLLSFGGNYSNHLVALAAASNLFGFRSVGYIRGDTIDESNKTIQFLLSQNMQLHNISRTQFRDLDNNTFLENIAEKHNHPYIIPLGGTNHLALKGIEEMMTEINHQLSDYNYICTPIGSGGTAAGIISSTHAKTLVFNTFKKDFTPELIHPIIGSSYRENWETITDYHFNGFAKKNQVLIDFVTDFKQVYNIQLDYVYNGKMMFGIFDMISNGYFKPNQTIIAIHTGGIQGNKP